MTKLQKRAKSEALYLPVALQPGVSPASSPPLPPSSEHPIVKPKFATTLSPFQKTHRRAASTPRTPQTQWPLIASSSPPSMAYPISPSHDGNTCGANCTRCGKKQLIQLNSPPSANIPSTAAPLRPIPQAHMRAVSEGVLSKAPKRLSITTHPATLNPGKPPCCQKCGRHKRPASLPVQSSSKHVKVQMPPMHQRHNPDNPSYNTLRTTPSQSHSISNVNANLSTQTLPSRPPSPPSPSPSFPFHPQPHIISPLFPRRKVLDFTFPHKSLSGASNPPYSPLSQSDSPPELGAGRLITLISNAIRETSPPLDDHRCGRRERGYTPVKTRTHSRNTSLEAVVGLGMGLTSTSSSHLLPSSTHLPAHPTAFELDSTPIDSTTSEILSAYSEDIEPGYAEYTHDWTDVIPVIRLPSVNLKEGISRFKSLRGGGSRGSRKGSVNGGLGRRPSVRERFGSLRRGGDVTAGGIRNGGLQQQGWYGRSGAGPEQGSYQALGSSVEVGAY